MAVLGMGTPASAAAPSQQGWWAQTSGPAAPAPVPAAPVPVPGPGSLPVPVTAPPQSPVPAPTQPTAPDVPSDGLLVAAGPTASMPTAYAAVLYSVSGTAPVGPLTLTVAPNSGTTPNAQAQVCALKSPTFRAEQGGPMTDAPPYVTTGCVTGTSDGSGNYKFDVGPLVADGELAVAILPVGPTDRIVFSKPGASSLPGADSDSLSNGGSTSSFGSTDSGATSGGLSSPGGSAAFGSGSTAIGSVSAAPAPPANTPSVAAPKAAPSVGSAAPAAAVATDDSNKVSAIAVALTVAGVVLLAGLWLFAGRVSADAAAVSSAGAGRVPTEA